ncbi:hypothetical protein [Pseudomonas lutea]|uniref:hypothetical protein n=1 Tax=Pseudomonas lutea TaxID=243924 RepID=UPI003B849E5B
MFAALPDYVLISGDASISTAPLHSLISLLRSEADLTQMGGQFIVNALRLLCSRWCCVHT